MWRGGRGNHINTLAMFISSLYLLSGVMPLLLLFKGWEMGQADRTFVALKGSRTLRLVFEHVVSRVVS